MPEPADDKLRRIERIASSASWQERAMTPQLFTWFCNEILQVVDIDGMDDIVGPLDEYRGQ